MSVNVKVKLLCPIADVPKFATEDSACADLHACLVEGRVVINPQETVMIPLGFATEIPEGYCALIYARSGAAVKRGIAPANKVGVIDSDYRGEWMVALHNHSKKSVVIEDGERIAQVMVVPVPKVVFEVVSELNDTERGSGGFGSTGK